MTMPNERTRALRWAGEFLAEVRRSEVCPEEFRRQAHAILRHYPDALDIAHQAKYGQTIDETAWLLPENYWDKPAPDSAHPAL